MVLAKETTISRVLSGGHQLRIPRYQRHYEWKKEHWDQLWKDVVRLALERRDDPGESHFLGSVVLAAPPGAGQGLLVIDGQQRIVTVSLLLCALRDGEVTLPAAQRARIHRCLLLDEGDRRLSRFKRLRVLPSQFDQAEYSVIVERGGHAPTGQVTRAYEHFRSLVADLSRDPSEAATDDEDVVDEGGAEVPTATPTELVRAIVRGLECVNITAQAEDNVHRIFESLNNTGTPLTQSDLIRNYVFARLDEKDSDFYDAWWLPLEQRFPDSVEFTQLFWLDLLLDGHAVPQRQTYMYQQRVMKNLTRAQIKARIEGIYSRGDLWDTILHPDHDPSGKIGHRLQRLKDWKTTTVWPVLMYLLEQRRSGLATIDHVERAMGYLESYFVRRVVIGKATMNMNRVLMAAPARLAEDPRRVDVALRSYLSGEGKHWASDDELRALATTKGFYNHGRAHQKRLILRWIEEGLRDNEDVLRPDLTIEHVMPQQRTAAWNAELRRGALPGETPKALHEELVHTLGNLTLTVRNTEMSNKSFREKMDLLNSKYGTGMQLTADFRYLQHWGPEQIRGRSLVMVDRIISFWPGPVPPESQP